MEAISTVSDLEAPGIHDDPRSRAIEYPLPRSLGNCILIADFLSATECKALIAQAEARGFASAESDYPPSYRNNDRQVLDDPALAERLLRRLNEVCQGGAENLLDADQRTGWRLQGVNERLRLCRYRPGQQFRIHQDGVHHRGPDCRSMLTFMVYLTDGDEFEGGDTLFYGAGPAHGESADDIVARVRPRAGSLILFDHGVWHAGATVTRGTKYILRSDLLFHRTQGEDAEPIATAHHQGYIWALATLAGGGLASGGRDGNIRLWKADGTAIRTLTGHGQSVLGLADIGNGLLASISRDRTLRFWATASGRCLKTVTAHRAAALSIARLSDRLIATGGADHSIQLWSAQGEHLRMLEGHQGWVWGLAALADDLLASVSEDGSLRIWDLQRDQCIARRQTPRPMRTIDAHPGALATGDANGNVRLWAFDGERLVETASFTAHAAAVRRVRFLRDGRLATCGEDNCLRIWDIPSLALLHEDQRSNFVTDVVELQGGATVSCGYDGELVWS